MRTVELRLALPAVVDLRVLDWLASSAMLRWHEWHMARMDHRASSAAWERRIRKAHGWRIRAAAAFPETEGGRA